MKKKNRCGWAVDLIHTEYKNKFYIVAILPKPRKPLDNMNKENNKDSPVK